MSLKTIKNFANPKALSYLVFFITNKCNASCVHCFYWDNIERGNPNELKLEEIESIAKRMNYLPYLLLSGGEPFLRKDIHQICKLFIEHAGTTYITIPTNGILTKRIKEVAEELVSSYPQLSLRIQLSIDGVGENHDRFRGFKGNFEKLMQTHDQLAAIKNKYNNLSLGVITTLCKQNYPWLEEIIDHVNHKMQVNQHHIGYLRSQGRGDEISPITAEEFKRAQDLLQSTGVKEDNRPFWKLMRAVTRKDSQILEQTIRENKMVLACNAINKFAVLSEEGNVFPCEVLTDCLGNVRESNYDIPAILHTAKARELQKKITDTCCFCTWECAIHNNIISTRSLYPSLALDWLKISITRN